MISRVVSGSFFRFAEIFACGAAHLSAEGDDGNHRRNRHERVEQVAHADRGLKRNHGKHYQRQDEGVDIPSSLAGAEKV